MNRAVESTRYRLHAVCAAVMISAVALPVSASDETSIQPDDVFQSAFRDISTATNEETHTKQLDHVRSLSEGRYEHLISQLLLYHAANDDKDRARIVVGRIVERVKAPKQTAVFALVPHLDNPHATIRETVSSMLGAYEDRSAVRPPDFSAYRAFIEAKVRAGQTPPNALIKHMYETDPGSALLAIMRGHQLRDPDEMKPILWAERVVDTMFWKRRHGFLTSDEVEPEAVQQLRSLSTHERWWVRMYVAEIVRQHAELADPQILETLRNDDHPLVRETILAAEARRNSKGNAAGQKQ